MAYPYPTKQELRESTNDDLIKTYENLVVKDVKDTNFKQPGPSKRLTTCIEWARAEILRRMANLQ